MPAIETPTTTPKIWPVGALCRAIADALEARFNPVAVRGEVSGFSRASSGHCYFSLKDENGQLRCAMFRRAASLLNFAPRDGELVELRGRLGVYEPRGDLQLIVESMSRSGQGNWFEQFLQLKAKLDAQGLFEPARKRPVPVMPRGIGLVTSLGAAALHDVVSVLQRRVPHLRVVLAPASVQGAGAAAEIIQSLSNLYLLTQAGQQIADNLQKNLDQGSAPRIDVILLVRGGGAMEDLWAFNDEALAHCIAASPVPLICGVGHEVDFTIADFVADLRAPTPTAAAELVAQPRELHLKRIDSVAQRLQDALMRQLDQHGQRLDLLTSHLSRPSAYLVQQRVRLAACAQGLRLSTQHALKNRQQALHQAQAAWPLTMQLSLARQRERLQLHAQRLNSLAPALVLRRGYAWLRNEAGDTVSSVQQVQVGQRLRATLADGSLELTVTAPGAP